MEKKSEKLVAEKPTNVEKTEKASPVEITGGENPEAKQGKLDKDEKALLVKYSKVIQEHAGKIFEVAKAVYEIQRLKLYRENGKTFDVYMEEELGMGRSTAYHYAHLYEVYTDLSTIEDIPAPTTDAQVRPLLDIKNPEKRKQIWQTVAEAADGEFITGPMVVRTIDAMAVEDADSGGGTAKATTVTEKRNALIRSLRSLFNKTKKAESMDEIKPLLEKIDAKLQDLESLTVDKVKKPKKEVQVEESATKKEEEAEK